MVYSRSASAQKLVDAAYTKMICYYRDGNARTWWGRNGINNHRVAANPFLIEVRRHQKYVAKNTASLKMAIIYEKATGEEKYRWDGKQGLWV